MRPKPGLHPRMLLWLEFACVLLAVVCTVLALGGTRPALWSGGAAVYVVLALYLGRARRRGG